MIAQFLLNGVVTGAGYVLMALGFALIYNTARIFHLAHGAIALLSGYAMFFVAVQLGAGLLPGVVAAVLTAALLGAATELSLYNVLRRRGAGLNAFVVGSFGLFLVLQGLSGALFGTDLKVVRSGVLPTLNLLGLTVAQLHVWIIAVCAVTYPALQLFLQSTPYGRQIRAVANNPDLAVVLGVNVQQVRVLVFALGSGLAGLAMALLVLDIGVSVSSAWTIILVSAVAVTVGGIGYLPGAAVGGLIIGLAQNLWAWQLPGNWPNTAVFLVLFVILLALPRGVFGRGLARREA
ncbi:MAG: branched-chain amino acid ABC transporter permease [Chloroflexi bacterium]|nr:branched-chain amino acid ABC transporter permease [Chloroflexota bacterium]